MSEAGMGTRARALFDARHYPLRVNCANCGTFYLRITGADEPEHLVACKKCDRFFVWFVAGGRVVAIGEGPRAEEAGIPPPHTEQPPHE